MWKIIIIFRHIILDFIFLALKYFQNKLLLYKYFYIEIVF